MYNSGYSYGQQPQPGHFAQPNQQPFYSGPPPPAQSLQGISPQGFGQQPYAQQPAPQQTFVNPALSVATDPNAFAQMFKGHLAALTFNSKPIITNLTVIAHEHSARMSAVVAQCLDEHIVSCPPPHRLPAFYVVDSICKNVGAPYTTLWADRIVPMFMETYRIVDHGVKVRLEELLSTWRTTGPGGQPLFGEAAQYNIERSLFGSQGPPQHRAPVPQAYPGAIGTGTPQHYNQAAAQPSLFANPEVTSVLARFERLISTSNHNQQFNPAQYDATRHEALTKLRDLVATAQLSAPELEQIEAQVGILEKEMLGQAQPQVIPGLRSPQYSATPGSGTIPHRNMAGQANASGHRSTPTALPANLAGVLASIGKLNAGGATPPSASRSPLPGHHQALKSKHVSSNPLDLIANLRKAGLIPSGSATPEKSNDADAAYSQLIKGMNFKLTAADLQRESSLGSFDAVVARNLPLQCRQCANRYPSGPEGQASLDKHLDWHFRQNRRAKDSIVRGQSRSWFSRLDEWVRGGHDDTAPLRRSGEGGEGSDGMGGDGAQGSALTPQQEAELKEAGKSFVLAPTDDPQASSRPCPVCKEMFKSEWSEDEEDFVWKNCVLVEGVYYHGTCHFSAKTLRNAVTGRARAALGSREGTPQMGDRSPRVASTTTTKTEATVEAALVKTEDDSFADKEAQKNNSVSTTGVKRERDAEQGEAQDTKQDFNTSDIGAKQEGDNDDEEARMHKLARTSE